MEPPYSMWTVSEIEAVDKDRERLKSEVGRLTEQNEKLLRKFKRIPATIADAYNQKTEVETRLAAAHGLLEEYRRGFLASKMFGETNFFKKMEKVLNGSESCTKADAEEATPK